MGNGESTSRRIAMQRADDGSIQVSPSGCSIDTVIAKIHIDFGVIETSTQVSWKIFKNIENLF